jgi:septal ring factor EnvC (AmiA/AmiB activator)
LRTKRSVFVILILTLFVYSVADDISQKERELSEVQRQIQEQNRRIREAEERSRRAERTKEETQSELANQQRKLQDLITEGQNLNNILEFSRDLLMQTEHRLIELHASANQAMLYLLLADQSREKLGQTENDTQLLAAYLRGIIIENKNLNIEKEKISTETQTIEMEYDEFRTLSLAERSRFDTITSNLRQLDNEIQTLQRQREEFQNQANALATAATELQTLINSLKRDDNRAAHTFTFTAGLVAPVVGRILTAFGPKRHDRYDISTFSNGVDISVPENTSIRALSDGEVVYSDWLSSFSRMIIIDHKNGYHSVYSYLNSMLVRVGDIVTTGQIIAQSGKATGTGEPCLHFEIRRNGIPVNPLEIVEIR